MGKRRILIVGGGDVAWRAVAQARERARWVVVLRDPAKAAPWRQLGAQVVVADLDRWRSLARVVAAVDQVWVTAPPAPGSGSEARTRHIQAALRRRCRSAKRSPRVVYLSTSGVYGDRGGAWVRESDPVAPQTARGKRRVAAETLWRAWVRRGGWAVRLRVPGIYAADRLPLERIRQGVPAIVAEADSVSNHIHADDLARLLWWAGWRGRNGRVYHACDDRPVSMGTWFDAVADAADLPRPPRLPRREVLATVGPMMASFLRESRRLTNDRLRKELRFTLRYPSAVAAVATLLKKES